MDDIRSRIDRIELPFNIYGIDPYGISKKHLATMMGMFAFFYRNYFSVSVSGIEHVPPHGRAMLVGNHSGGVALDAAMVIASCFLELDPPRLAQGMAEKFIAKFPFASSWASRTGQFTGIPEHAERLLEDDRLLVVFPEGARGTAKLYPERDSLVDFGTGFVRLAMRTKTPIVPFGFIGGGDAIPTIANAYSLGKLIGAPYIPITPWIFAVPRPVPLAIEYGEPITFDGSGAEDDEVVSEQVDRVKSRIAELIAVGRSKEQA